MASTGLLVVTTRSRLRGVRFFPAMLRASLRIRRQLAGTAGVVRWASVIVGPTEFWTITVWDSRQALQEFMSSGAHGEIMWRISEWLRSFWLLRWRPGRAERGTWEGLAMAPGDDESGQVPGDNAGQELARMVFADMPALRDTIGADGAPSYAQAPLVRLRRAQLAPAAGAVVRLAGAPRHTPAAVAALWRMRRGLRGDPELFGAAVGIGRAGEAFLITVWQDGAGARRLLDSGWARSAAARWGDGYWAAEWRAENEFGHWDGARLRAAVRPARAGPRG